MTGYIIIFAAFVAGCLGLRSPFVWVLGYLWLDYLRPQQVDPAIFYNTKLLLIFGVLAVLGSVLRKGRVASGIWLYICFFGMFVVWITITTTWSMFPDAAYRKLDAAVPAIVFSIFLMFAIRTREDLAHAIWAILLGSSVHVLTAGIKSAITGGGYAYQLGIANDNYGLAESSTLGVFAIASIPLVMLLDKLGAIPGGAIARRVIVATWCALLVAAAIGSFSRSGLLSLGVLFGVFVWLSPYRGRIFAFGVACAAVALVFVVQSSWFDRMSTLSSVQTDGSSLGRIGVWSWTLDYVLSHPLGGGFWINNSSVIEIPSSDPSNPDSIVRYGVGFHSLYFEVLGEQGWIGLFLYLTPVFVLVARLLRMARGKAPLLSRDEATMWVGAWLVMLTGFAFVSVAYLPYIFNFVALSACHMGMSRTGVSGGAGND